MDATLKGVASRLERASPTVVGALGIAGVVVVAVLDLVTGNDLAFSFFYLIPVATVAWFGSLAMAIVIAMAGAVAFPLRSR